MRPRHQRDLLVTATIGVVVALQAWWMLSRNPVALASEGPDTYYQGKVVSAPPGRPGEPNGEIVPGPGPERMDPGEGRDDRAMPALAMEGPANPPPGTPVAPAPGVPAAPPPGVPRVRQPVHLDDYHRLLLGIALLDRNPSTRLTPAQAQALLVAIKQREGLRGNDVADAISTIIGSLEPPQRAYLEARKEDRRRRRVPPMPPGRLPTQIQEYLGTIAERKARL